jgi:SAM-dependent methyltransferase
VSDAEREKWDDRYRGGAYEGRSHPTALLSEWLPRLRQGRALDLACGTGRNASYLAAHGYAVDALDISAIGLERGRLAAAETHLDIRWLCIDLDDAPERALETRAYDLIVWVRYVNRGLMPHVIASLKPGGHLLCEQHLASTAAVIGPKTPAFRLERNELRDSAVGLRILHYREGEIVDPDGRRAALAQLIAEAPG